MPSAVQQQQQAQVAQMQATNPALAAQWQAYYAQQAQAAAPAPPPPAAVVNDGYDTYNVQLQSAQYYGGYWTGGRSGGTWVTGQPTVPPPPPAAAAAPSMQQGPPPAAPAVKPAAKLFEMQMANFKQYGGYYTADKVWVNGEPKMTEAAGGPPPGPPPAKKLDEAAAAPPAADDAVAPAAAEEEAPATGAISAQLSSFFLAFSQSPFLAQLDFRGISLTHLRTEFAAKRPLEEETPADEPAAKK